MRFWTAPAVLLAIANLCLPTCRAQSQPTELHLNIIEGDGAINNLRTRTNRESIVQVTDQNHRPVAGAAVSFHLPESGASGAFKGGTVLKTLTNAKGLARAVGFRPNTIPGSFEIHVTASFQGHFAAAIVTQTNVVAGAVPAAGAAAGASTTASGTGTGAAAGSASAGTAAASGAGGAAASTAGAAAAGTAVATGISTGGIVAIAGGVAAGGAVAGVVATHSGGNGSNNSQTSTPTGTIGSPGTPTIGPAIAFPARSTFPPVFIFKPGAPFSGNLPGLVGRLAGARLVRFAIGHFTWGQASGSIADRINSRRVRR